MPYATFSDPVGIQHFRVDVDNLIGVLGALGTRLKILCRYILIKAMIKTGK